MTPAELAIRAAVIAVEETGCDERLTDAVVLLQEAKERVADFVDKWPRREKLYTESEHRGAIAQAYERCANSLAPSCAHSEKDNLALFASEFREWGHRSQKGAGMIYGYLYRAFMRFAHRYNWHYAPIIGPLSAPGDPRDGMYQRWCRWCGFRQSFRKEIK